MTFHRPPRLLVSLAFVALCSACAGTASQTPGPENGRGEKIVEARADLSEARARLDLAAAKSAKEEQRWGALLALAQKVYDSGHFKGEAGHLLGIAQTRHGSHLAALETFREVREIDPTAVSGDELEEALVVAISQIDYREPERRLELRMELVRMAPERPIAAASEIRSDMVRIVLHHYNRRDWAAMLEAVETLASSPRTDGKPVTADQLKYDFFRASALWHLGEKARAKELFEAYLDDPRASNLQSRLSQVIKFFADKNEHQYVVELYERALGRASYKMDELRLDLTFKLAEVLLSSDDAADKKRGEKLLRYYVGRAIPIVRPYRKDNVYSAVRRLAARHGLLQLSDDLLDEAIENGSASRYMVESRYKDAVSRGEPERARALADKYLKTHRSASDLWDVARWARGAGQWKMAYEYMGEALEELPRRDSWWFEFARVALKLDKKEEAVEAVQKYLNTGATSRWDVQSAAGFLSQVGLKDEAIRVVRSYHRNHPNDSRTTTYLASLMTGAGQRDQALEMLRELAKNDRVRLYQVMEVARYVQRDFGDNEALEFYIIAGERGEPEAFVEAASIAMSIGELERYDKLAAQYMESKALSFYDYQRLWYVLRDTNYQKRKLALLEKMLDARGAGNRGQYRSLLTREYIRAGRSSDAFALWENGGAPLEGRAFTEISAYFPGTEVREKLIEEYRKKYPDDQASRWVLFFVAEQHYALYTLRQRLDDASLAEARRLYRLAFERIEPGRSDRRAASSYHAASTHFERRQMPDLAEKAMVRYVTGREEDPKVWLAYAQLLLRQGRNEAATQVMYRYIQTAEETGSAALDAAGDFRRYLQNDQAEAYYKMALAHHQNNELSEREHRDILRSVGEGLGHLYLTSGRIDDFLELTSDFYAKYLGHHPYLEMHDRSIDLNGLESRGRWSEFVERVERLPKEGQRASFLERQAKALWYLGRRQEAWKTFEKHHSQRGYDTGYRWLQLAEFLETRGGEVLAATAYDRAVRYGSRHRRGSALLQRARFLVRQGHYEAAIGDFIAAKKSTRYGGQIDNAFFVAFNEIGRQDIALEVMEREDSPFQHPSSGVGVAEDIDLEGVHADKIVEQAKRLASQGHSLEDILGKLSKSGRYEAIATIIDERLVARDFDRAAKLLYPHADGLAAVDRLGPIVEQLDGAHLDVEQEGVKRLLADYFLQTGQLDRALELVNQNGGFNSIHSTLALELALGREQALSQTLSFWMENYLNSRRTRGNLPLAVDFIRFGQQQTLSSLLERFTQLEQRFGTFADTYASDLLAREGVGAVVEFLRRTGEQLAGREDPGQGRSQRTRGMGRMLVRGAALLAASGYSSEVEALFEELPKSVRDRSDVGDFIERLSLFADQEPSGSQSSGDASDNSADNASGPTSEASQLDSWRQIAEHARVLTLRGDYEGAEALLNDAFRAMIGDDAEAVQGSVSSGKRRRALRMLLRLHRTTGDSKGVDELIELWLAHVGRDNFAADELLDALSEQGFYDHAARIGRQIAQDFPTGQILQKAVLAAANADDYETVEALMPVYWRSVGTNGRQLGKYAASNISRRFTPKISQMLLEPHLEANPNVVVNRISEIVIALRAEDVERARALIISYLNEFAVGNDAVLKLARELNGSDHSVEVARVIGPYLERDGDDAKHELTVEILQELAEANATIGRYEDAERYLELLVSRAANSQLEASKISRGLTLAGHRELGLKFADRAFSDDQDSASKTLGHAHLARGLARLANAQTDADLNTALEDLGRGLEGRQENVQTLAQIAVVALRAEQYQVAETYMTRLLRVPAISTSSYNHPLRVVIDVLRQAGEEQWGVAFLDRAVPDLMQGAYLVDSIQWTELIGDLLTDAGMRERADAWFTRAILYHRLESDRGHNIDGLLNARALNLAVNGGDADRAVALSRKALASASGPNYSFLVTLALAQKSAGENDEAQTTFRQAIRAGKPFDGNYAGIDAYLQSVLDGGTRRLRIPNYELDSLWARQRMYPGYRYTSARRGYRRHQNSRRRSPQSRPLSPPFQIYRGTP